MRSLLCFKTILCTGENFWGLNLQMFRVVEIFRKIKLTRNGEFLHVFCQILFTHFSDFSPAQPDSHSAWGCRAHHYVWLRLKIRSMSTLDVMIHFLSLSLLRFFIVEKLSHFINIKISEITSHKIT